MRAMQEKMKQFKSTNSLAELVEMALHDFELAEKDPKVVIDFGEWYRRENGFCLVCFAGSVLRARRHWKIQSSAFVDPDTSNRLCALNYIRMGKLADAARTFGISGYNLRDFDVPNYYKLPTAFKAKIREIINYLREWENDRHSGGSTDTSRPSNIGP